MEGRRPEDDVEVIPLTALETQITQFTQELKSVMSDLKIVVEGKSRASQLEETLKQQAAIQQKILTTIGLIESDAKRGRGQTKVTNFYFNYFMQLVAQYNALFFSIGLGYHPSLDILKDLGFSPIQHPLLGSAVLTDMSFVHKKYPAAIFRDPVKKEYRERERYYYDHNHSTDDYSGSGLSFPDYYARANKKIGLDTQVSNVSSLFTPGSLSQLSRSFWRAKDLSPHAVEKAFFKSAWKKIKAGEPITKKEKAVLESGEFYRGMGSSLEFPLDYAVKPATKAKHFHVGHATQVIDMGIATVTVDPINFHCFSKAAYGRHTEAGNHAEDYFTHIIAYTHNHYDHMDAKTAEQIKKSGLNPLFIVPAGDAKYLRNFGFKHVIEFSSWNDVVHVTMTDRAGNKGVLNIYALPARHASNREPKPSMPDINTSLYMGFILHREGSDHATLVTGDTAVLDDEHMQQLAEFAAAKNITFSSACIAAGPDRPRSHMECTHQSTADGISFHAKLNVINAQIIARRRVAAAKGCDPRTLKLSDVDVTKQDFEAAACEALGYHQGCFRLGVLNYNDVEGTITRTLAVLDFYQNKDLSFALNDINEQVAILSMLQKDPKSVSERDLKKLNNFPLAIMDNFERVGLIKTLETYQRLFAANNIKYTAADLKDFICRHTFLPKPGQMLNLNEDNPALKYDFQRLIVNRDPGGKEQRAYEEVIGYMLSHTQQFTDLIVNVIAGQKIDEKALLKGLCDFYLQKKPLAASTKTKQIFVQEFLKDFDKLDPSQLINAIIRLRGEITKWRTADEEQRDEGHLETVLLICYGLMTNPQFRTQFHNDYDRMAKASMQVRR